MYTIEQCTLVEQATAVIRDKVAVSEMPDWFGRTFAEVAAAIGRAGAGMAGPPFARYRQLGDDEFEVEAGFPVITPIARDGTVEPSVLPGGPAIGTEHIGPYDTLGLAYAALSAWLSEHGATAASPPWEVYFSEPTGDPATWRTGVLQPYAAANAGAVA